MRTPAAKPVEMWRQRGLPEPLRLGKERHSDQDSERDQQRALKQSKDRASQAIETAQPDGVQSLGDQNTKYSRNDHYQQRDQQKGNETGCLLVSDHGMKPSCYPAVIPRSHDEAQDQSAQAKQGTKEALYEARQGGQRQNRHNNPIGECHRYTTFVYFLQGEIASGQPSECLEVLGLGALDHVVWQTGGGRLLVPPNGFKVITNKLLVE